MMQHLAIWLTCVCRPFVCMVASNCIPGTLLATRTRTATDQRSFAVNGPRTRNSLPTELRTHHNLQRHGRHCATLIEKLKIMVITLDNHLTMDSQVSEICRSPFYHTRALRHMRPVITAEVAKTSACSFVTSRFDYDISVLYGKWPLNESCCVCCCLVTVEYSRRRVGWFIGNRYGRGSGRIWLDNVVCNGNENDIDSCYHLPRGSRNCSHDEDVSVSCLTGMKLIATTQYERAQSEQL